MARKRSGSGMLIFLSALTGAAAGAAVISVYYAVQKPKASTAGALATTP